jgi:hypothetical protein
LRFTRRHTTLAAAAGAGLTGAIALAFAVPALADGYDTISINPGNVPTTAAGFSDRSCDQIPDSTAAWLDGWVFVLPNSVPAEGNFKYIEAVFQDEDGNVLRYDTNADGGIVSGSGDNKAYIITPAGLTLIDADAEVDLVEDDKKKGGKEPQFNLTHTCPATEDEPDEETPSEEPTTEDEPSSPDEEPTTEDEPSSPGEEPTTEDEPSSPGEEPTTEDEPSSPGEEPTTEDEPSSPGEQSSSPGEQSSSPAATTSAPQQSTTKPGSSLPITGSPLAWVLAAAGVLLVAGAVILVFMSRRREAEEA